MRELFIDSGIFIHLFDYQNKSDTLSSSSFIRQKYEALVGDYQAVSTNFVIAESLNHISDIVNRGGSPYTWEWVLAFYDRYIAKQLTVYLLDNSIWRSSLEICQKYKDQKYSLVDASCFAFLDMHDFIPVFTTDRNWLNYRHLKGHKVARVEVIDIFFGR